MSPTPCSQHPSGVDASGLARVAASLTGSLVRSLRQAGHGGNSRLYRVEMADGVHALKLYPPRGADGRDRLTHERAALTFLHRHGAPVPRLLGADAEAGAALLEWVDGPPPPEKAGCRAMIGFLERLHGLRHAPDAAGLPQAVEACPSVADLLHQIESRRARLAAVADEPDNGELGRLLGGRFDPALARLKDRLSRLYDMAGLDPQVPTADQHLTLSPSDFGLHNALSRAGGGIVFIDFEYFGWDDPVKLVADTLWHPGMQLSADTRIRFLEAAGRIYGGDPAFAVRLASLIGFFGLRWCLIVLSDFLPDRWAHRAGAGAGGTWTDAKRVQAEKANVLLDRVSCILAIPPMDWPAAFHRAGHG